MMILGIGGVRTLRRSAAIRRLTGRKLKKNDVSDSA